MKQSMCFGDILWKVDLVNTVNVGHIRYTVAGADRGFLIKGTNPIGWSVDFLLGCFSAKTYAKTKELGPVEGRGLHPAMC